MKLFQRLLILLFTLLVIGSSFLLTIYSFGLLSSGYLEDLLSRTYGRYEVGLLSLVVLLLAIYLLVPLTTREEKREATIEENELGILKISLEAIRHLIEREVHSTEGIEEVKPHLKWLEDGLEIRLSLKVLPQMEIPSLTTKLQTSLKEHVQNHTGVKVQSVRILVEEISTKPAKTPIKVD